MKAVFVTGATGTVGAAVVAHLAERGEKVIAAVRRDADAERLPKGVEARRFEFTDDATKAHAALDGVDRLFLMRPPAIADVQTYLFPLIDAARTRGVRQIVFLSLQGVQANRGTPHHAVEAYLRQQDAPYTLLRPNFFMQNLSTTYATQIRDTGEIFVPAGWSRTAFIDARDIGRVAASVFTEPGHLRKAYTLSGEASLSYGDVARIMSDVLGRPIVYARPSERDYLEALAAQGAPTDYIDVQRMIYRVVRLNVSALPNRAVRKLTGQPATTFAAFVRDHRAVWLPAAE
ncbi:SDR family oxidoreductase [Tessaracoccus caeni]|uniref:SDR family oxidoreductase n=1 Tax=Tessaracoccus caeni TaxID=3031239 RepID=UPI0023DB7B9A|nr:SDR family oxidoreductase [Tessaracoccus caeni]MDF1488657.1 SDR family oxidoreductase [Tessaracoccus caeni]